MFPEGLGMSRPETKGSAGLRAGCKHHNFRTGTKSTVGVRKVLLMLLLKSPKAKKESPLHLQDCFKITPDASYLCRWGWEDRGQYSSLKSLSLRACAAAPSVG